MTGTRVLLCATCGGVTRAVEVVEHIELGPLYLGALRYPFADGHLAGYFGLSAGVWFFSHVPMAGEPFAAAIAATYLLSVVPHTARGRDTLPEPTDFIHFTDYLVPAGRALASCALGCAPFVMVLTVGDALPGVLQGILALVTGAMALAWIPAAMAWASIAQEFMRAADPRPPLAIITRAPKEYAFTVWVVWGLGAAHLAAMALASWVGHALRWLPVVPGVLVTAAWIYAPMVMARVVGLLLRARKFEIGVDV
jgi:hypothetical protein